MVLENLGRSHESPDLGRGGAFEGELGEIVEAHGIRQYLTASEAPWQNGLVERNGGIWKAAARTTIKDAGARGFVEMRRLASMVNWVKNPRMNLRQPNGSSVEDTTCHGRFWMRCKVVSWHRWSCQITRLSLVDDCHGCGLQDVRFETMDASHRLRRALSAGVRASSHTPQGGCDW